LEDLVGSVRFGSVWFFGFWFFGFWFLVFGWVGWVLMLLPVTRFSMIPIAER